MIVTADIILKPVKGKISIVRFLLSSKEDAVEKAKKILLRDEYKDREPIELTVTYPLNDD
jgi:hypothetical protein